MRAAAAELRTTLAETTARAETEATQTREQIEAADHDQVAR